MKPGKKKGSFWIVNIIALLFMFGFGYVVKPFGPVTETGVSVIGVFLGVVILAVFTTQMFYLAALGMAALVYHGYLNAASASNEFLGTEMIVLVIFVTGICAILQKEGTMNVISKKILTNKVLKGKPILFLTAFFLTTYFISIFLHFAPACILMFSLFESIRDECGYEKKDEFSKFMLLGIYLACMGSYALPYIGVQAVCLGLMRGTLQNYGLTITDGTYFISNVVILVVFLICYTLCMPNIFKCNLNPLKNLDLNKSAAMENISTKLNKRQTIPLVTFGICIAYIVSAGFFPKESILHQKIFGFGEVWIWVAALAILSILRVNGERFINGQTILQDYTMWNLLFLIGIFSTLGKAMGNKDLGIGTWLTSVIQPLFSDLNLPLLIISSVVVVSLLTQLLNGLPIVLAAVAVVLPFAAEIALEKGINVGVVGTLISLSAGPAFITYSGSVWASLILSREEIDQKFVWTKGLLVLFLFLALTSVLGIGLTYTL